MDRLLIRFPKIFRTYWIIALATFLLVTGLIGTAVRSLIPKDAIPIAAVLPLSGEQSAVGKEILQSIQLYINSVNRTGGVNGYPLKLLIFDDASNPITASKRAQEIADSRALVVLGHWSSVNSGATGQVYQSAGIPAITGSAFADNITLNNPYYFRAVYSNSAQGSIIATYIQRELKFQTATVVYTNDNFGRTVNAGFESTFKRNGAIKQSLLYYRTNNDNEEEINRIVNAINTDADPGVIFLGMTDDSARGLIVALKRQGIEAKIFGTSVLGRDAFSQSFQQYEEEKRQPGYFTDEIYAASPLIFDSANADAQEFADAYRKAYGSQPGWPGAKFYDAARIAVSAIQAAQVENTPKSRSLDRQHIRDQLTQLNQPEVAFSGLTGPIYFDSNRNAVQPVRVGQFLNRKFVSTPVQYAPITNPALVDLEREIQVGNIIPLNNQYVWQQRVVYTGIDINKLSRVDQTRSSFTTDFYVWFRYSGNDDPLAIEFPDATSSSLNPTVPLFDPKTPLKSRTVGGVNYRLYQVRGDFKNGFDFRDYPFDSQKLAIRFQNTLLSSDRLIYVTDTFGLKLPRTDFEQQKKAFQGLQLWTLKDIKYLQDSIRSTSTLGDPDLFGSNIRVDYPGFSALVMLQRNTLVFLIKNLLPLVLLILVSYSTLYFSYSLSVPRILATCSALLSGIVLLLAMNNQLPEIGYTVAIEYAFYVFFFLSLFSILTTTLGERLEKAGKKHIVWRLNLFARVFFPVVVSVTIAIYGFTYSNRLL